MKVLVLSQHAIRSMLSMSPCIDLMASALSTLASGDAVQPLRSAIRLPNGRGLLGLMPAYLGDIDAPGVKVVTVYPGNHGTSLDSHQGVVLLFEGGHGSPIAILDGTEVTAIRTAAASGLATRLLAGEDAGDLAILGSGVQARQHLKAMAAVRTLRRVRIFSRDPQRVQKFVSRHRDAFPVEAAGSVRAAVEGADLICTTTSASEPILEGEWIAAGAHINAVGACIAAHRELDTDAVTRSRIFVDRRESALNEAGDLLIPIEEGRLSEADIEAELGDLVTGAATFARADGDITLFKSLGIGVEDVAVARYLFDRAKENGAGTWVELGGERDDAD